MENFNVFIYEDYKAVNFLPLIASHFVGELLVGARTLQSRIRHYFGESWMTYLVRGHLADVVKHRTNSNVNQLNYDPSLPVLLVNSRAIITSEVAEKIKSLRENMLLMQGETPVALVIVKHTNDDWKPFFEGGLGEESETELLRRYPMEEVRTVVFDYIWDMVTRNIEVLESDFKEYLASPRIEGEVDEAAVIYNPDFVHIEKGAIVDAFCVLDARTGPIWIEKDVHIYPYSYIQGPCYLGEHSLVFRGFLREGCSFGPESRIGGEVEQSIFLGYSNKYHDGFVGHSYIGNWVNLGALTTTSDLRNDYGSVKVSLRGGERVSTGVVKVGSFIGDYVALGIGTLLNTGSVINPVCNFYGGGMPPTYTPPFIWGSLDGMAEYEIEKALENIRRIRARRGKELPFVEEQLLRGLLESTKDERELFIRSF